MTLGEKLQMLRRARGLSQEQLAEALDLSRQAVSKWENGDSVPDLEKLKDISRFFGVTTDYLLFEEQTEPEREQGSKELSVATCKRAIGELLRENWLRCIAYLGIGYCGFSMAKIVVGIVAIWVNIQQQMKNLTGFVTDEEAAHQIKSVVSQAIRATGVYLLIYLVVGLVLLWLVRRKKKEKHDDI